MTIGSFLRHTPFVPLLVLALLIGALYVSITLSGQSPTIDRLNPSVAYPGDQLTITGKHFGNVRGRGHVSIAGVVPTTAAYQEWSDSTIRLTIPDNLSSGLVYVITDRGRSDGALLTDKQNIPQTVESSVPAGYPSIESVDPATATPGALVTITGRNFGMNRGDSRVDFAFEDLASTSGPPQSDGAQTISAQPANYDYQFWSDREIEVRVPDGAASGDLTVVGVDGRSNAVHFDVVHTVGTKTFRDRKTYSIRFGVDISNAVLNESQNTNDLYLWVPRIQPTAEQRNVESTNQTEQPMFPDVNGLSLFRLQNILPGRIYSVAQTVLVERYAEESTIIPDRITNEYDKSSALFRHYTGATSLIPANDGTIDKTAVAIVGRAQNPYNAALAIYNYLLDHLKLDASQTDPMKALDSGKADDGAFAELMVAMLRSVGIPSRVDTGVVVSDDGTLLPHHWLEFYLSEFGWVPVDVSLVAGQFKGAVTLPNDPRSYYFGNIDNRHVVFSQSELDAEAMDPAGRDVRGGLPYSEQTMREESAGNLGAYTSDWLQPTLLATY